MTEDQRARDALAAAADLGAFFGTAEQPLGNAEMLRQQAPVLLAQTARHAALDELLDIGGIAADQAREGRIVLASRRDKLVQPQANGGAVHSGAGPPLLIPDDQATDGFLPRLVGK